MAKVMFRTGGCKILIEPVEIERTTEHQVVLIDGRMESKASGYYNWFETFDDAKAFLVSQRNSAIEGLNYRLIVENEELEKVLALVENDLRTGEQ